MARDVHSPGAVGGCGDAPCLHESGTNSIDGVARDVRSPGAVGGMARGAPSPGAAPSRAATRGTGGMARDVHSPGAGGGYGYAPCPHERGVNAIDGTAGDAHSLGIDVDHIRAAVGADTHADRHLRAVADCEQHDQTDIFSASGQALPFNLDAQIFTWGDIGTCNKALDADEGDVGEEAQHVEVAVGQEIEDAIGTADSYADTNPDAYAGTNVHAYGGHDEDPEVHQAKEEEEKEGLEVLEALDVDEASAEDVATGMETDVAVEGINVVEAEDIVVEEAKEAEEVVQEVVEEVPRRNDQHDCNQPCYRDQRHQCNQHDDSHHHHNPQQHRYQRDSNLSNQHHYNQHDVHQQHHRDQRHRAPPPPPSRPARDHRDQHRRDQHHRDRHHRTDDSSDPGADFVGVVQAVAEEDLVIHPVEEVREVEGEVEEEPYIDEEAEDAVLEPRDMEVAGVVVSGAIVRIVRI